MRDWLEERRVELAAALGQELPRPVVVEEARVTEDPELARIRAALLVDVPDDPSARSAEQNAKALLADLLDWHRREDKPGWWRYFYLRTLGPAELIDEPDALGGLTGGDVVGEVKRSVVRRFSFPPQEHRFAPGDTAHDSVTDRAWTVVAVDDAAGTIDLKIGAGYDGPLPVGLVPAGPSRPRPSGSGCATLVSGCARRIRRRRRPRRDAATALLLRARPADGGTPGAPLRRADETTGDAAVRLVLDAARLLPAHPGPARGGEDLHRGRQILDLIASGRTVGITGPSHCGHPQPDRQGLRARRRARRDAAHRAAHRQRQPAPDIRGLPCSAMPSWSKASATASLT